VVNISRLDKQTRRAILVTRLAIWIFLIVAGYGVLASIPGGLPPLKGIAVSDLALAATVVTAIFAWMSARASERSVQVMEKTFKAANDSALRLEFLIYTKVHYPSSAALIALSSTTETEELKKFLSDLEKLSPEQALTQKHGIYATVQNMGPGVARKVSLVAKIRIAQPNIGSVTKDVKLPEISILQVMHRRAVLAHVFDDVSDQCRIGLEHATITYTTSAGETRTDEWSHFDVMKLGESPIRGFD
jgi:hypothetical protein